MKILKSLSFLFIALPLISCSVSAQNDNNERNIGSVKGEVIALTTADFRAKVFDYEKNQEEWVYEGDMPCIVDFYADWCPPCKKVAPVLKDLATLYENKILIYKVNIDQEKDLAAAFGIQSIPTFLFIPEKGTPQIARGALPREEFIKQIDGYLLGKK